MESPQAEESRKSSLTSMVTTSHMIGMVVHESKPDVNVIVVDDAIEESGLGNLKGEEGSIIVFPEPNDASNAQAKELGEKFGKERLRAVDLGWTDMSITQNQEGVIDSFDAMIGSAKPLMHKDVLLLDMQLEALQEAINNPPSAGRPFRFFPGLSRLLKGHRPGELTVLTGPTGSGKTTLLAQMTTSR
jgi:twinkle protein